MDGNLVAETIELTAVDGGGEPAEPDGSAPVVDAGGVSARNASLGVLFVHGIGFQKRGDTLMANGEALVSDLKQWMSSGDKHAEPITWEDVDDGSNGTPAHATVEVRGTDDNEVPTTQRWLLAESWWSESFKAPKYRELSRWALQVAPWTMAFHFNRRVGHELGALTLGSVRDEERVRGGHFGKGSVMPAFQRFFHSSRRFVFLVLHGLVLALALLAVPIVLVLLLLLRIIRLIPLRTINEAVQRLQNLLTGTVGDSYVLLSSDSNRARIQSKVRRDLRWLAERSDRVAVVAHSQGAAIAHRVIADLPANEVPDLYVAYGSGLKKLTQISEVRANGRSWHPLVASAGLILMTLAAPATYRIALGSGGGASTRSDLLGGLIVSVALSVAVALRLAHKKKTSGTEVAVMATTAFAAVAIGGLALDRSDWLVAGGMFLALPLTIIGYALLARRADDRDRYSLGEDRRVPWEDFVSSHDPVPNGPLLDHATDRTLPITNRWIHNEGSVIGDHTSYWRNPEGFVIPVATSLARTAQIRLEGSRVDDRARITAANYRRGWRVRFLYWLRCFAVVGAVAVAVGSWNDELPRVGQQVWDAVRSVVIWLPLSGDNVLVHDATDTWAHVLGLLVLATVSLSLFRMARSVWSWWNRRDAALFHHRAKIPVLSVPTVVFTTTLTANLAAQIAVAVWLSGNASGLAVLVVGGAVPLAFGIGVLVFREKLVRWSRAGDPSEVLTRRVGHLHGQLMVTRHFLGQRERFRERPNRDGPHGVVDRLDVSKRIVLRYLRTRLTWVQLGLFDEAIELCNGLIDIQLDQDDADALDRLLRLLPDVATSPDVVSLLVRREQQNGRSLQGAIAAVRGRLPAGEAHRWLDDIERHHEDHAGRRAA